MSDLISRQAAIDALRTCQTYLFHTYDPDKKISLESAEFEIEQLLSVQPEIIRCKECRYYEWMNNRVPAEQTWFCHNWNAETGKDDYCSYAERREE